MVQLKMATLIQESAGAMEAQEDPIYGDVLEEILSRLPLLHLIPALQVSNSWNQAVHSSLIGCRNPPKPWLILHPQPTRSSYAAASTHAYDPRSHLWMKISHLPPIKNGPSAATHIRSPHSNFLYVYSPSMLSVAFDPLNLTWHHLAPPLVWRADPVVAKVGDSIIVAGGTCDFEDDPLAVEIYVAKSRSWRRSHSMPAGLKDSGSSTWLSIASTDEKLFVMEKQSGKTHCFDLNSGEWSSAHDIRPDPRCFYSLVGWMDDRLIVVGLIGDVENAAVKVWEVGYSGESFEKYVEIGEMPAVLVHKLKSETLGIYCINICLGGRYLYIYNPEEVAEIVACEVVKGGACIWGSVKNTVATTGGGAHAMMMKFVLTCADVKLEELRRSRRLNNRRFEYFNT